MKSLRVILFVIVVATFSLAQTAAPAVPTAAAPAPAPAATPQASTPSGGEITGTVKAGTLPLPGVAITAANTLTGQKVITSTDPSGAYTLLVPSNGRWVIKAELAAFATATKEAVINAQTRNAKVDVDLQLQSRAQAQQQQAQQSQMQQMAQAAGRGVQQLGVQGAEGAGMPDMAGGAGGGGNGAPQQNAGTPDVSGLPNPGLAMGADAASESLAVGGRMGNSQNLGNNLDDMRDRLEDLKDRIGRGDLNGVVMGGPGMTFAMVGGPGGGGGGMPMPPPGGGEGVRMVVNFVGGGGGMGKFNVNRPHGFINYGTDQSIFDARQYSLNGNPVAKPDYQQHNFGANFGGPLNIPHVYSNMSTMYFVGYNGRRSSDALDRFMTVPTLAERGGDFNGIGTLIYNPTTHAPFTNNQVPLLQQDSAARGLLPYIPLPNQPGTNQNFHYVTTSDSRLDAFNVRFIKNFGGPMMPDIKSMMMGGGGGATATRGGPAQGKRGAAGQNGRNNRRRRRSNLNFGLNYNNVENDQLTGNPNVAGKVDSSGINVPIGFTYGFGRFNNSFNFNFNRQRTQVKNLYAGITDIEGALGITGTSRNSFDWGIPGISLTHFSGLNDITPSLNRNQTISFSDNFSFNHGKVTWRFGGDYRRIQQNIKSSQNARGSYTFTGIATAQYVSGVPVPNTGFDFADFLLGLPQQTAAQFGVNSYYFRGNNYNAFVQADWKATNSLTLNLGLRYEYISPFAEKYGRIVNLDANQNFTAVAPVLPDQTGAFSGQFPRTLVNPDRNNWAPRIGIAWKPFAKTVVRTGYGWNYNLGAYAQIVRQMAFQPPFAFSATNIASPTLALTLKNGFPAVAPGTITNSFGVDPDYHLGYVQSWNLDIQRELPKNLMLNVGYTGSKGTALDMLRAPNRGPTGLRIAGVQPFTWQSSEGASILHSGDFSLRRRMTKGFAIGGRFTWSKSLDNASGIGGGANLLAQDDQNLAAERSYSSFDVRRRFSANYTYELPFGERRKWLQKGPGAHILGQWEMTGNVNAQSGTWFTPRILGNFIDVGRGSAGTLRPNVVGPIALSDPKFSDWFNTAAFVAPAAGTFGNARRNSVQGPGGYMVNMSLSKNFTVHETQGVSFSVDAQNAFNTARYSSIDTLLNSPTYGKVVGVQGMRRFNFNLRYRF